MRKSAWSFTMAARGFHMTKRVGERLCGGKKNDTLSRGLTICRGISAGALFQGPAARNVRSTGGVIVISKDRMLSRGCLPPRKRMRLI